MFFKMALHGLAHHFAQVVECLGFRKDGVAQSPSFKAAFGALFY